MIVNKQDGDFKRMNSVAALIRDEISCSGPVSCARFMQLALYSPEGYYQRRLTIGRQGDFYTSVSVGSLFGELLAFQFGVWMTSMMGQVGQIVEAGAHDGRLAADVLGGLERFHATMFGAVEYWIIEPSAEREAWQRETLGAHLGRVKWWRDWSHIPASGVQGVIFSNELFDAMPVHQLAWDVATSGWRELGVNWNGTQFVWTRLPELTAGVTAPELPDPLLAALPDGFVLETCPEASRWWESAARALRRGKLLAIDYGLTELEFLTPQRCNGTLRAYSSHHPSDDPLSDPGSQDLTTHVNFTALQQAGEAAGLKTEDYLSQAAFLGRIAPMTFAAVDSFGPWDAKRTRAWQTLTHPEHLGRAFRALVQSR